MKKVFVGLVGLVAVVGLFFLFAPEERVIKVKAATFNAVGYAPQLCLEANRDSFVNPSSAYLVSSSSNQDVWTVNVMARNGMGNYVENQITCTIEGKFFTEYTTSNQINDSLAKLQAALYDKCTTDAARFKSEVYRTLNSDFSTESILNRMFRDAAPQHNDYRQKVMEKLSTWTLMKRVGMLQSVEEEMLKIHADYLSYCESVKN